MKYQSILSGRNTGAGTYDLGPPNSGDWRELLNVGVGAYQLRTSEDAGFVRSDGQIWIPALRGRLADAELRGVLPNGDTAPATETLKEVYQLQETAGPGFVSAFADFDADHLIVSLASIWSRVRVIAAGRILADAGGGVPGYDWATAGVDQSTLQNPIPGDYEVILQPDWGVNQQECICLVQANQDDSSSLLAAACDHLDPVTKRLTTSAGYNGTGASALVNLDVDFCFLALGARPEIEVGRIGALAVWDGGDPPSLVAQSGNFAGIDRTAAGAYRLPWVPGQELSRSETLFFFGFNGNGGAAGGQLKSAAINTSGAPGAIDFFMRQEDAADTSVQADLSGALLAITASPAP